MISAVAAWYTASALILSEAFGHEVWESGRVVICAKCRRSPSASVNLG
jgi:hypothetical protein